LDSAHSTLVKLDATPEQATKEKLDSAAGLLDAGTKVALKDATLASGLTAQADPDRALLERLRATLKAPQEDDALKRWRNSLAIFQKSTLPGLIKKRDADSINSGLYDLKSSSAFSKADQPEKTWVTDTLAKFTARAKVWAKIPARFASIPGTGPRRG